MRAAREHTTRLAKSLGILITRSAGSTGVYVTPPESLVGTDPWGGDHLSPNWLDAQQRVDTYAEMLSREATSAGAAR